MTQVKHHYQRVDLGENGYLEATRDDTDEIQDLHFAAYLKDGTKTREVHVMYNIQYDYSRHQLWRYGVLIKDSIVPDISYGHLQEEFSIMPPEWWVNPYPDNFEPVKPEGADIFHCEGRKLEITLLEHKMTAELNFYIFEDLQEWRKPDMNLITGMSKMSQDYFDYKLECEQEQLKTPFDPVKARADRIDRCKWQENYIGVKIPYDPRFID